MTDSLPDWEQLGRYLAGESPPEENAEVRAWLDDHASDAELLAALDRATRAMNAGRQLDVESALRRVKSRVGSAPAGNVHRFGDYTRRIEMIAAAAAILLVAGVFIARRVDTPRPAPEVGYATGVGQRDSVVLDDGSTVLLGPASRVTVRGREVALSGEAFFRVRHDASRPFTVHAGTAVIRDIGTEFSVHSDSGGDARVRVIVHEGAVQLRVASDSLTLRPDDVGVVDSGGRIAVNRGAATADDLAWTRGRLVFREASIPEMAADLRRWHGVELRVTDSALLRKHFTGSFVGESRDRVLDVIALAFGARVEQRGDTAYILPIARAR